MHIFVSRNCPFCEIEHFNFIKWATEDWQFGIEFFLTHLRSQLLKNCIAISCTINTVKKQKIFSKARIIKKKKNFNLNDNNITIYFIVILKLSSFY